jgi:hypothetical protein
MLSMITYLLIFNKECSRTYSPMWPCTFVSGTHNEAALPTNTSNPQMVAFFPTLLPKCCDNLFTKFVKVDR